MAVPNRQLTWIVAGASALMLLHPSPMPEQVSVIVQARDVSSAKAAVRAAGGRVTHELGVIHAVGARVGDDRLGNLRMAGGVRRVYADGAVTALATCGVAAWASMDIHDDKLEWELTNHSSATVTVSRIEVEWPVEHGSLEEIELSGKLLDRPVPPPSLVMESGWDADLKDRQLKSGETRMLKVKFGEKTEAAASAYAVRVEFAEGCAVAASGDDAGLDAAHPGQVGVDELHELGIDGEGVAVAIVDTGWWNHGQIKRGRRDEERVLATYDAIENDEKDAKDKNGHGTHVASVVVASAKRKPKKDGIERFAGIAPGASLVVVRAFDEDGAGTYADVVRGIDWVIQNRDQYGIRVLNASFGAPVRSHYWTTR